MSDKFFVITVPVGDDEIICDLCNRDIEENEGGSFIGSYSVCSICTKRILKTASKKEKEEIEIINGNFREAVLKKRRGEI